jgi:hypothetical protein
VAGVVFEDADVVVAGGLLGQVAGEGALIEGDFEEEAAAGVQARKGFFEDSAVEGEAVGAAVEGGFGFVVTDAAVEGFDLGAGDVGRVGDDQIEGLGVDDGFEGGEEVAFFDGDAAGEAEAVEVAAGDGGGGGADLGGDDDGGLEAVRDGGGDAPAAGAEVEDAGGVEDHLSADGLDDVFDEGFGVGAGDQGVAGDLELEVEEMGLAGEVGDRFVLGGALDEVAEAGAIGVGEGVLVVGVELDAGAVEDVGEEELGGQAGGGGARAGVDAAGPLQRLTDRPWAVGLSHRARDDNGSDAGLIMGA